MRKRCLTVVVVAACGLLLGACGSPSASSPTTSTRPVVRDCTPSPTNINLQGCDLAHKNLKGLDMASDNLQRTNLSYANLIGTDLQGANLKGARTTGVVTNSSTICVNAVDGPCTKPGLRGGS